MEWDKLPDNSTIEQTVQNLEKRGIRVIIVNKKEEALEKIKEMVPTGSEVMSGSSITLEEIGFSDYLNSEKHGWKNLHAEVKKENDSKKRTEIRRKTSTAEYFLGSVNAISKNGELVACDNSGSRVGAYLYSAKNLILISGAQKITENLEQAMKRVREHAFVLEDARAKKAYGFGSNTSKWVILEKEPILNRVKLILVKEKLGY